MPRTAAAARTRASRAPYFLQKPNGQLTDRVQRVGPEHFGIVALDGAKMRSRLLLADFYGHLLLPPTTLTHDRGNFQAVIDRVRQTVRDHDLHDLVVALERTGEYHRPLQRAFHQAGYETRLVHPCTTLHYRQPADPGNKTDDTDLAAIFRAVTNGFGLVEPVWPELYLSVQLLRRHRRDLVDKNSIIQCQIREVLHAAMPGYAELFCHLWDDSPTPLVLARHTTSAQAVLAAGYDGLQRIAADACLRCHDQTFHKILTWARQALPGHAQPLLLRRQLITLDDDRLLKTQQIVALERDLAHLVVRTPYSHLLAIPGINIVSVADLAGELGPMEHYLDANAITGRAGLMPARYQSDQIDHADGHLRRRGNRRLRAVLLQTADNLVQCNAFFRARAEAWKQAGKDPRWLRVKVAKIVSRLVFAIVGAGQVRPHPCCQPRHYLLRKLLKFHQDRGTPLAETRQDLEALVEQLPASGRAAEADPLREELEALNRRRGPQPLAAVIDVILARLAGTMVQSQESAGP